MDDRIILDCYVLQGTESEGHMQRTKGNIRDSDATLIISLVGPEKPLSN